MTNSVYEEGSGNFVSISLTIGYLKYRIINIYTRNSVSPDVFEAFREDTESSEHHHCIVSGDFNLTLNPSLDSYNYKYINNPKAQVKCVNIMDTLYSKDAFRHLNGDIRRYS